MKLSAGILREIPKYALIFPTNRMTITSNLSLLNDIAALLNNVSANQKKAAGVASPTPTSSQTDSASLTGTQSDNLMTSHGYYVTDGSGGRGFSGVTTLTEADKQLVKDVTGWDIDADPQGDTASNAAKTFAGRMNMDRYSSQYYGDATGTGLIGPATASYIRGIINQQQSSGQNDIPLSMLYKAASAEFFALLSAGKIESVDYISGNESLRESGAAAMKMAQLAPVMPNGNRGKILRQGVLSCSTYTTPSCQFVMFLP